MKKRILSAAVCAALLTGCQAERHPIPELPPASTTAKTSSTYTGTTVEFIHVQTETESEKKRPSDSPYIPDFPETDDLFGDSFSALFSSAQTETQAAQTSASAAYSEEEGVVTAAPPRFEDTAETTVTSPPDGEDGSAAEAPGSFDIKEYMPREEDYPEFPAF